VRQAVAMAAVGQCRHMMGSAYVGVILHHLHSLQACPGCSCCPVMSCEATSARVRAAGRQRRACAAHDLHL
jgi:hypothetical protein